MKNNNNNNNDKFINIIPVVYYPNADLSKNVIYNENRLKSGIYRWKNLITNKSYVGSSVSLSCRFRYYYSLTCLEKKVNRGNSAIHRALLKYGYSNFSLDILEYCEPNELISREQYYIDKLKPEYNILKKAGSILGFKHSEGTKLRMSINNTKEKHPFYGKKRSEETILRISINSKIALTVKINDISTNEVKIFRSNVQAGKYLGVSEGTIRNYKKSGRIYKGKYLIS
jgi:excinuclease UvrABC nuclease subunit